MLYCYTYNYKSFKSVDLGSHNTYLLRKYCNLDGLEISHDYNKTYIIDLGGYFLGFFFYPKSAETKTNSLTGSKRINFRSLTSQYACCTTLKCLIN